MSKDKKSLAKLGATQTIVEELKKKIDKTTFETAIQAIWTELNREITVEDVEAMLAGSYEPVEPSMPLPATAALALETGAIMTAEDGGALTPVKISELPMRSKPTGREVLPFQENAGNGKFQMESMKEWILSLINAGTIICTADEYKNLTNKDENTIYLIRADKYIY